MGWKLGKYTAFWAGSFIESKKILYPEDYLEICVRVNTNRDNLIFKVQADTSDVNKVIWQSLYAKQKKISYNKRNVK